MGVPLKLIWKQLSLHCLTPDRFKKSAFGSLENALRGKSFQPYIDSCTIFLIFNFHHYFIDKWRILPSRTGSHCRCSPTPPSKQHQLSLPVLLRCNMGICLCTQQNHCRLWYSNTCSTYIFFFNFRSRG